MGPCIRPEIASIEAPYSGSAFDELYELRETSHWSVSVPLSKFRRYGGQNSL